MKTILNTYIEVESQEQADRLKQVCIDNGLPIWKDVIAFKILIHEKKPVFGFIDVNFFVYDMANLDEDSETLNHTKVTEPEFMELLTKHKEEHGN